MRFPIILTLASCCLAMTSTLSASRQQLSSMQTPTPQAFDLAADSIAHADSLRAERLRVREADEIVASLPSAGVSAATINKVFGPWVFLGYRNLMRKSPEYTIPASPGKNFPIDGNIIALPIDSLALASDTVTMIEIAEIKASEPPVAIDSVAPLPIMAGEFTPQWLRDAMNAYRIQEDFIYSNMVANPEKIDYSYWDLPVPPRLTEDDMTFSGYLRRLNLPSVDIAAAVLPEQNLRQIHWLHTFGASLHFSQAYVSPNWYQGGNNHLALLFNFNWNVQLNQVYHPNLLFQSNLVYKLGLNSTPQDEVHKYSISEDLFQYNINTGVKAFKKWFYSLNALFKTQLLRNYEQNSMKRTASFLSPGDLNVGLGMAYSHQNKYKTLQLTATISPLSYNLKTCITDKINHSLYNIDPDKKVRNEFGSNGEFNMTWNITTNIQYKTRVFVFTDYSYFLGDWENTLNFEINRFLSTQIYAHLRYDTSADSDLRWKRLQLREVLSFGLSYTFSTKP